MAISSTAMASPSSIFNNLHSSSAFNRFSASSSSPIHLKLFFDHKDHVPSFCANNQGNARPNFTVVSAGADNRPFTMSELSMEEITADNSSSSSSSIDFLTLCHRLKTTKRKGWINHEIANPESIADHMYLMAIMALIAADIPGINRERCIKIAIVHDIAEAIVGDITPSDGVPKAEKSRRELEALNYMCEVLGEQTRAEEVKALWTEYENNATMEAKLVKDFDKVEMILQALEYETEHGKVLDEFYLSTAGKFQTDIGKRWAAEILSRRSKRLDRRLK